MSRQGKYYQLHLNRGKVPHEPESLSEAGSAGKKGRVYVVRINNRAKVTYAAATPAVRAKVSKTTRVPFKGLSGARQHPVTIAGNAAAYG
jgi:hypothetical protein